MAFSEQFKIKLAADARRAQIVFDDKNRKTGVLWNHYRAQRTCSRKHHVIAFGASVNETFLLKNALKDFPGNRIKLGHV
ncbi:MAG TPA: hypothetical protein PLD20_05125 [Blastocatellia bacterium]|nr:hypothetical protein [Blastocatellia bacterium]HMV85452.1 hypothetical protein [Blastocatellia bacterium]HMX26928.1 hypothetical protein [Blastocatellia bacterium]HMY70806.1 hypothetical protein [Blastocatellia bacterium]HMZ17290.1 hypothetical protein [Blastocatellia bacterium]